MSVQQQMKPLSKVVVILGPTASGKSKMGLRLAQEFGGEIISADSRQIYKKMDIGTGKEPGEAVRVGLSKIYHVGGIPHHLIDFLDPGKTFTAVDFRDQALKHIRAIEKRKKHPVIVGGTGLYLQSLIDNYKIPRVPPNKKLRQSLEQKNNDELMRLLESMDPDSAQIIDSNNKRRIVRALEVCILSGKHFSKMQQKGEPLVDALQIGIDLPRELLYERIGERVDAMIEQGLIQEIDALLKQKYSWNLPSMSGIGYRQFKEYFEGTAPLADVVSHLKRDTRRFARRQLTWFRRDQRIHWCKTYEEARALVQKFYQE